MKKSLIGVYVLIIILSIFIKASAIPIPQRFQHQPCDLIVLSHLHPYENMFGAANRLTEFLKAAVHSRFRIHLFYEQSDGFAEESGLVRWQHPNVFPSRIDSLEDNEVKKVVVKNSRIKRKRKTQKVSAIERVQHALRENDFSCDESTSSPIVISFIWPWRPLFVDIQLSLHAFFKETLNAAVIQAYDDNFFLYYAENSMDFDDDYRQLMFNITERALFDNSTTGFVGISGEVSASLEEKVNSPEYQNFHAPVNMGVLPFSNTIENITYQNGHASYKDSYVDFLLMGDLHPGNVMALEYLCEHLVPKLLPSEQFHIVGKLATEPKWLANVPALNRRRCYGDQIKYHGFVSEEELRELLLHTKTLVAPITVHTGVSTKLTKSLSFGTPAISTEHAFAGISDMMMKECRDLPVIVTDIDDFASQI